MKLHCFEWKYNAREDLPSASEINLSRIKSHRVPSTSVATAAAVSGNVPGPVHAIQNAQMYFRNTLKVTD